MRGMLDLGSLTNLGSFLSMWIAVEGRLVLRTRQRIGTCRNTWLPVEGTVTAECVHTDAGTLVLGCSDVPAHGGRRSGCRRSLCRCYIP